VVVSTIVAVPSRTVFSVEITAFTIAALAGVAVLFTIGVVLIWLGFRNNREHLPSGAEDILAAIADGSLEPPTRREYGRDITGEHVRLISPRAGPEADGSDPADAERDAEDDAAPVVVEAEADETGDRESDDDRHKVGVGMLRSDDTGEMAAPARAFFSGEPELKRF
jgi:hypothetical protein